MCTCCYLLSAFVCLSRKVTFWSELCALNSACVSDLYVCVYVCTSAYVCLGPNRGVCVNGGSVQLIALSVASPGGKCH